MSFFKNLPPFSLASSVSAAQNSLRSCWPQAFDIQECKVSRPIGDGVDLNLRLTLSCGRGAPFESSFSIVEGEHNRFLPMSSDLPLLKGASSLADEIESLLDLASGGLPGYLLVSPLTLSAEILTLGVSIARGTYGPAHRLLRGLSRYLDDDELHLFEGASKNLWREAWIRSWPMNSLAFQEKLADCLLVDVKSRKWNSFIWLDRRGDRFAIGNLSEGGNVSIESGSNNMRVTVRQVKHLARAHHTIDLPSEEADLRLTRMQANPSQYFKETQV